MAEKVLYLRKSKQYVFMIIFFHLLAATALIVIPIYISLLYLGVGILVISLIICLYTYHKSYLHNITLGKTFSDLIVENINGEESVQLLPSSVVTEFYICLHCKKISSNKKFFYILLRDSFDSNEDLRILASWMRQAFI